MVLEIYIDWTNDKSKRKFVFFSYQKDAGKTGWKIVDKLLCTKTGEWNFTYYEVKDEKKEHVFGPETLSETMKLDSSKAE